MASEASRKKALEIVGASVLEHDEDCGRLATPTYSGQCGCGFEVLADEIAAALDETRAEGVAEGEMANPPYYKLPLGHPYVECRRLHGRRNTHDCWDAAHCDDCGQPRSAHEVKP